MRYIKGLSKETIKILNRIHKSSKHHQVRKRAHCILLSYERYSIAELMKIFKVSRNTIYNWFNNWESSGLVGLYNQGGQGRRKTFDSQQQEIIKSWAKETPKQLSVVQEKIEKKWGIKTSRDTIKRVIKGLKMKWKRMRSVVGGKPQKEVYERKKKILEALKKLSKQGAIDLRYLVPTLREFDSRRKAAPHSADESGFCLTPYVPYCWQENDGKIEGLKSQRSPRINVIGLLNQKNELESYIFEKTITSEVVINFLDQFAEKIKQPTVVVIDNAPIHTPSCFPK
jgi:transposase